jgi:hypothetical protein
MTFIALGDIIKLLYTTPKGKVMTKSVLQIHPEEGRISRTFKNGKVHPNVGSLQQDGYLQMQINGKLSLVHRIIYEHVHGSIPDGMVIDHINRDKQDNRIENLRLVTISTNSHNSGPRKDSKTGVKGVGFDKCCNKFRGEICVKGSRHKTKYFETLEEASKALEMLKKELINLGHKIL